MDRRKQNFASRPESFSEALVSRPRSPFWPDGRLGPAVDPAAERPWALATLAMLGVVLVTLGTLVIG